jgi:hypothetical protein
MSAAPAFADTWKFGVVCDTQWTCATDPAGQNPNAVSVSIINQLNQPFINQGVAFVIQVGDLTENGNTADVATRAAATQALYNAGIGLFPMRGNHETYANPANGYAIDAFRANFPQTRGLANTFGAINFSSPTSVSPDLDGMSYSFDFGPCDGNARFVVVDDWATPGKLVSAAGYSYGYSIADQQAWISQRLNKRTRETDHVFVFSHQNLMGENHQDCLFNGYTNANPDMQNAFFASLQTNSAGYYISGHDHIHQRSIIASPDGHSAVRELICASDSSKFYTPKAPNHANWFGQKGRETSVSQEMYTVGYYVFTVDGPRVTVEFYSDDHGNWLSDNSYPGSGLPNQTTPTLNFVLKETWGYSLNGKKFLVPQGGAYTVVQDTFEGTTARIPGGVNGSVATDYNGRHFTKTVDTGWTHASLLPVSQGHGAPPFSFASNILTLWGMADLDRSDTDVYVLSMTYKPPFPMPSRNNTNSGIVTRNANGDWVNAVDMNTGGVKTYVKGPWKPEYGLGTYGVDVSSKTAWAVVNFNGDFAVARDIQ